MDKHFIVSGYARSGTSMMMHCLGLGGLPLYYDKFHKVKPGSNKYGSYEVPRKESITPEAYENKWRHMFEHPGEGVKIEVMKIKHIPKDMNRCYHIVFMLRHPQRIYMSLRHQWGDLPDAHRIKEPDDYYRLIGSRLTMLASLKNVVLDVFEYSWVVEYPRQAMERLANNGWPIDPAKAALGVERDQMRF